MPDIDDWVFEFERAAAPLLKEIFERDLNWTIPVKMIEQLDRLRVAEEQLSKREPTVAFGSLSVFNHANRISGRAKTCLILFAGTGLKPCSSLQPAATTVSA